MQYNRHDPRSECNWWKSERRERQRSWVVWGVLRPNQGFSGQSTLRKFLGSKEHIDWLKIDLNAAELITVQNYKYKKENVNGSTYTQC